jgi:hypothetical protein
MKPDNGQHVIVCRSYGDFRTYACTLENARAILAAHLDALPREVNAVASLLADESRAVKPVEARLIVEAFAEVLDKAVGEESPKLRRLLHGPSARAGAVDERPPVSVTEADQQALVLWLFKHGLSAAPLDAKLADKLDELHPENDLALLEPFARRMGRPICYVRYPEYLEAARALGTLHANRWKEDAAEARVVERYLEFVRQWLVDTSDTTYEVSTLQASFK